MRIAIDGYNLIRNVPELASLDRRDLEAGRKALLDALSEYRRATGHGVTVVFDGARIQGAGRGRTRTYGVDVVFSAPGQTADAVLCEMCRRQEADVLVSADRAVVSACVRRDLTAVGPEEFWGRVEMERMAGLKGEAPEEPSSPSYPAGRKPSKRRRKDIRRLSRL